MESKLLVDQIKRFKDIDRVLGQVEKNNMWVWTMRVFAVSDFHGSMKAVREAAYKAEDERADIIVVCGDITHFGSLEEARVLLSLFGRSRLPVLFVPGNCDPPSLIGVDVEGARCIHGVNEVFRDSIFVGVGSGLTSPFHTPFELTEEEIMKVLKQGVRHIPTKRWLVLVAHTTPKGTKIDITHAREHIGSSKIRRFIEEKKPSIVFCGHVHEARGIDRIGTTTVVNPGPAIDGFYALADFEEEVQVELRWLP